MNQSAPGPRWNGRPITDAHHVHDLEQRAAVHEFQDGMPRQQAEEAAHSGYRREHHLDAAAHHLQGMRAAHAAGHADEAKKHGAMYALHLRELGEDPQAEPPAEVRGRAQMPDRQKVYRFKAHRADQFLLQDAKLQGMGKMANDTPKQKLEKFWREREQKLQTREAIALVYRAAKAVIRKAEGSQEGSPIAKDAGMPAGNNQMALAAAEGSAEGSPVAKEAQDGHPYAKGDKDDLCKTCGKVEKGHVLPEMSKSEEPFDRHEFWASRYVPGFKLEE